MDSIGKSNMRSVVVIIGLVVLSEAGIIHHNHIGYGLSNQKSYGRPAHLGRPLHLGNYGTRPALQYAPSFVSNSLLLKHASGPITVTRVAPPQLHSAGLHHSTHPAQTIAKVSLPASSFGLPLAAPVTNNLLPPVVLNSVPLNFGPVEHSPANLIVSPAIVNQPSVISPLQTLTSSHTPAASISSTYTTVEIPEKSVSYSVSHQDYEYLKHHQVEGQDSPYKAVASSPIQEAKKHHNPHGHHEKDENNPADIDNVLKKSTATKRGLLGNSIIHNSLEPNIIHENNQIIFPQDPIVHSDPELSHINIPDQLVSKHIYFHVPPPDFEEAPHAPLTHIPASASKKTYNIIFIKAPSQEPKNKVYLQQPQVEDKTLIYVLTKKQDAQDVILAPLERSKVSKPEVYFIKYRTKLGEITDVSQEHEYIQESLLESDSPILERKRRLNDNKVEESSEKPAS